MTPAELIIWALAAAAALIILALAAGIATAVVVGITARKDDTK